MGKMWYEYYYGTCYSVQVKVCDSMAVLNLNASEECLKGEAVEKKKKKKK